MSSISRKNFGRTTQVRHLPIRERNALIEILENEEAWKRVMACVRRTPTERLPCPIKYTNRHLEIVEAAANPPYRRCSEIFLKEWGCSGPKLPTLHDLLELVMEAEVYRAAYYVAVEILHESPPARPKTGLAALVTVPLEFQNPSLVSPTAPPVSDNRSESSQTNFEFLTQVETVQATSPSTNDKSEILKLEDDALTVGQLETVLVEQSPMRTPLQFSSYSSYSFLQSITNGFNDNPVGESGGRMLGKGGFGSVYLGIHDNHYTAIKKLYNNNNFDAYRVFDNEVKTLLGLEHPNLLHMIAYCSDGPANCVVYDYMWEGDLQERLSLEGRWKIPLTHSARMTIALGTSEGLKYLHEDHKPPLVHRDVKSANILLDKNLVPKIGDFGLARFGDLGDQTSTVIGTDCYMSPEAMSGDVSVKIDVFSFGVVLLELLTSLSPMKPYGDGLDLIFYVRETCDKSIAVLLDKGAGNWMDKSGTDLSEQLYVIAQQCLEDDKDERPLISAVVQSLRFLLSDSEITCHSNIDPL